MNRLSEETRHFVTPAYPPSIVIGWTKKSMRRCLKRDRRDMIGMTYFHTQGEVAGQKLPVEIKGGLQGYRQRAGRQGAAGM